MGGSHILRERPAFTGSGLHVGSMPPHASQDAVKTQSEQHRVEAYGLCTKYEGSLSRV